MGRREGFRFWFVFVLFHYQEYNVSLVSKLEETDAMVRRQREERAQNWISLNNWIKAMATFSNSLYKLHLPDFWSSKSSSGLVLNLILRKDRVCPSGLLKQFVAGIPSAYPLNCWNLAPVTSNKTLHNVYGN